MDRLFVGTYTRDILFGTGKVLQGKGEGIYELAFNPLTGKFARERRQLTPAVNPSYLDRHWSLPVLYAVEELKDKSGSSGGYVAAYRINPEGAMTQISHEATAGGDPCHVYADAASSLLLVSNFMSGSVAVYPIFADGSLSPLSQLLEHEGSSVNEARQKGPHAHAVQRSGGHLFVPDLGIDKVLAYMVEEGQLVLDPEQSINALPGSGPRQIVFAARGARCYVADELTSSVSYFSWSEEQGSYEYRQTIDTVPTEAKAANSGADIAITNNERFILASNRGHDSITCFAVDPATGELSLQSNFPAGRTPRSFCLTGDNDYLFAANQDSDDIIAYRFDPTTAQVTETDRIDLPTPVCVIHERGLE